jgi:ABC-type uncharacterized transport system permease subunit
VDKLKNIKQYLITALIVVIAIRIIAWAIEPFLPYIVAGLVMVAILGVLIYRRPL